jgi:peptidoglycan-associated lipoprotein
MGAFHFAEARHRLSFSGDIAMKISKVLQFAALSAALMLGACTTKQEVAATPPPPAPPPPAAAPAPRAPSILPGSVQDFKVNVGDTVHFGFNEYNVEDSDKNTLQKQATWLNRYPGVQLTIEGHADERGTREYNLALGARRANAVKEYLVSLGVNTSRLQTVSYGKERPLCTQSSEDCWAQNRRGVSTITGGAVS